MNDTAGKERKAKEKAYGTGRGPQDANGPRKLINPFSRITILGELPLLTVNMTNLNQISIKIKLAYNKPGIVADPTEGKNDTEGNRINLGRIFSGKKINSLPSKKT